MDNKCAQMLCARKIVEDHIAIYGMVPHPDKLKESIAATCGSILDALQAQVDATTTLARAAGLSDADIADCTAQARQVFGLWEGLIHAPKSGIKPHPLNSDRAVFADLDAAARQNLTEQGFSRYETYKVQLIERGHPPQEIEEILRGFIWDESEGD